MELFTKLAFGLDVEKYAGLAIVTSEVKSKREILEEAQKLTAESNEQGERENVPGYTRALYYSRLDTASDLGSHILDNYGPLFERREVLEVGPGVEGALHKYIGARANASQWQAVEISPETTRVLSGVTNYPVHTASMRRMPFLQDESINTIVGLCSLDSIIDFRGISEEFKRVAVPGGDILHIQDLAPSTPTLIKLLSLDNDLDKEVELYTTYSRGVPLGVTHIRRDDAFYSAPEYMSMMLARIMREAGFTDPEVPLSGNLRSRFVSKPFTWNTTPISLGEYKLHEKGVGPFALPDGSRYGVLHMQKPA